MTSVASEVTAVCPARCFSRDDGLDVVERGQGRAALRSDADFASSPTYCQSTANR